MKAIRNPHSPRETSDIESDSEIHSISPQHYPSDLKFSSPYSTKSTAVKSHAPKEPQIYNHRIILTTYPGQVGINPIPMVWGNSNPEGNFLLISIFSCTLMRLFNSFPLIFRCLILFSERPNCCFQKPNIN